MNKAKCANGHFYNADRFQFCPICGSEAASLLPDKAVPKPVDELSKTEPLLPAAGSERDTPVKAPAVPQADELPPTELIRPEEQLRSGENAAGEQKAPAVQAAAPSAAPKEELGGTGACRQCDPSPLSKAIADTGAKSISALPKTVSYYDANDAEPPVGWVVCVAGPYLGRAFECKVGRNRFGRTPGYEICLPEDTAVTRDAHAVLIYDPKEKQFYLQAGSSDGLAYLNGDLLFSHESLHPYDMIALGNSRFVFLPLCGERFSWDEYIAKG